MRLINWGRKMKFEKDNWINWKNLESSLETQKSNLKKNQKHILFSAQTNKKNRQF